MTKKIFFILLILFVTIITTFAQDVCLPKGSLIKVYTKIPLNTSSLEEGSEVYFVAPADVWVFENKVINKGDIFNGYVSMLKMPVQGVNAAMSIKITSVETQDGHERKLDGRIIFEGSKDVLGGNLTYPASYNKTIHPRRVYGNIWGGTLQYVPSGEYEFGHHVEVTSRDSIFVELDDDFYI